jgi:hypothetical protein
MTAEPATPEQVTEIRDRLASWITFITGWDAGDGRVGVQQMADCSRSVMLHSIPAISALLALVDRQAAEIASLELLDDANDLLIRAAREHIQRQDAEIERLKATHPDRFIPEGGFVDVDLPLPAPGERYVIQRVPVLTDEQEAANAWTPEELAEF